METEINKIQVSTLLDQCISMTFPWLQTQTFNILSLKSYRIFTFNVKKKPNSLKGYHNFFSYGWMMDDCDMD